MATSQAVLAASQAVLAASLTASLAVLAASQTVLSASRVVLAASQAASNAVPAASQGVGRSQDGQAGHRSAGQAPKGPGNRTRRVRPSPRPNMGCGLRACRGHHGQPNLKMATHTCTPGQTSPVWPIGCDLTWEVTLGTCPDGVR